MPPLGFLEIASAQIVTPKPKTSEPRWAASERIAIEPEIMPPMISQIMKKIVTQITIVSFF